MIELVKHIEILLLENDCVIVPGLGGFIAHNRPAQYCTETNEFCPPLRTIGFNPQLVMNDGLLVQSYMQAYNTDFPDATRKIERIVSQLKEDIYQQGQVELGNIGTLYYNVQGVYEFEPRQDAFFTPSLYGLEKVTVPKLIQQEATAPKTSPRIEIHPQKEETLVVWKQTAWKRILSSDWIQHAISVAAAILLFFILSTPVENTYVDEANYASLGSTSMFDAIRGESIVTTLANYVQTDYASVTEDSLKKARRQSRPKNNVNTLKPVAVKTEKIAAAPRVEKTEKQQAKASGTEIKKDNVPVKASEKKAENTTPKKQVSGKKSYVIVASFPEAADAEVQADVYRKQGYKDAQVIAGSGRYRVAISQFTDAADAYKQINQFKANNQFKDAWVFTTK
ncbi:SPOR domain-containing protein [Phocaeicola barnesiae]|uniref:HU domain-containing protein n=1 Tax=Phocaeicola barnesiae TaxID=376804 RepID=UPI00242D807B|nr:SPOR domain-containing protein [Phocaeicola barnesiae]